MNNCLKTAFESIRAEDKLKTGTLIYLQNEIQNKRKRQRMEFGKRLSAVFASVAIIFLASIFSHNLYYTPTAYVAVDVNPSIELTLNRFGLVIDAKPYNASGAHILNEISVHHMACNRAVQALLDEMIKEGSLKQDGLVSLTVQTGDDNDEQKILGSLESAVTVSLSSHHHTAITDVFAVSDDIRHHAHDYNLSPARYIAISELREVDPSVTFESYASQSISQIKELKLKHGSNHHSELNEEDNNVGSIPDTGGYSEKNDQHHSCHNNNVECSH